ncbi:MAG TPA: NADP-specific glutamate dehydrogenase [Arcobacter sp.]|jgi:glutamate dehydrogenase (NADP+)|nr:NADP-specific glutamate dehydrogenase [Arcobacter sp.]
MDFIEDTLNSLKNSNCALDYTFFQAVREVLESLTPIIESDKRYKDNAIIQRLVVPDRQIQFKVTWFDDNNQIHVNNGYRVQFNNVLGPYKGGLRFHPSVNVGILKFLAFEQIFKNSLTGLPIGGAKGGSDFDPKGKSDHEVMKFCRAFMIELHKYIGDRTDVPAGDIGVGNREIGYLYGTYKHITSRYDGVLTGKPFFFGGSLMRPEATGYGVVYFAKKMLELEGKDSLEGKICTVSGSGNVAIHTIEKLYHLGAIPVTCSDSKGCIYDKRGIDLELLKKIKLERRASLEEYAKEYDSCEYIRCEDYPEDSHFVWSIPSYAAFPCATQNEVTLIDARNLIKNDTVLLAEGANMPCTSESVQLFLKEGILFAPAKAANAGGVAVSEFEMSQNASMSKWSFDKVDKKLQETMEQICKRCNYTAKEYGVDGNYLDGANIAGFKKVADAMIAEGI